MVFPNGGPLPRHPSQLYEAGLEGLLLGAVLFACARVPQLRRAEGFLFGVLLTGYGISRFCVEYFREPDSQLGLYFGYFSMGQLLCVPMIIAGALTIAYARRRRRAAAKA